MTPDMMIEVASLLAFITALAFCAVTLAFDNRIESIMHNAPLRVRIFAAFLIAASFAIMVLPIILAMASLPNP